MLKPLKLQLSILQVLGAGILCLVASCASWGNFGATYSVAEPEGWRAPDRAALVRAFESKLTEIGFAPPSGALDDALHNRFKIDFKKYEKMRPHGEWGKLEGASAPVMVSLFPEKGTVVISDFEHPYKTQFVSKLEEWIREYFEREHGVILKSRRTGSPFA